MSPKTLALGTLALVLGFAAGWWILRDAPTQPPERDGDTSPRSGPGAGPVTEVTPGAPIFVELASTETGIEFRHENGRSERCRYPEIMGGGVGLFDADGDGDLDIFLVNGNRIGAEASPTITDRLYRNDGGWRFTDITVAAGVGDPSYGQGCCVGDFDRDGDVDVYVSNFGVNRLWRNEGGVFVDVAAEAGVADPGWGQSSAFLDFDKDGWLDLWVQNYMTYDLDRDYEPVVTPVGDQRVVDYPSPLGFTGAPDRVYRNLGNGKFEDVTEQVGALRADGKGMGIACVDFDDDGAVDVFVANDSAENFLFFGSADGTFTEAGLTAGVAFNDGGIPEASMGVDAGDVDGDGRIDLIVPCLHRQVFTLYRNEGGRVFRDVSVASGLAVATSSSTGFGANFIDYDADGDLDVYFTAGGVRRNESAPLDASYDERYGQPDILCSNDGRGAFTDVSKSAGPWFQRALIGRGSAIGDLDGDGDLDLVIGNLANRVTLLRNDTKGGHWALLELVDSLGVREPFGVDVRATVEGRTLRRVAHSFVGYLSQSDRRIHLGLGGAPKIDHLEIRWPSGRVDTFDDVAADRIVRIEEGRGEVGSGEERR